MCGAAPHSGVQANSSRATRTRLAPQAHGCRGLLAGDSHPTPVNGLSPHPFRPQRMCANCPAHKPAKTAGNGKVQVAGANVGRPQARPSGPCIFCGLSAHVGNCPRNMIFPTHVAPWPAKTQPPMPRLWRATPLRTRRNPPRLRGTHAPRLCSGGQKAGNNKSNSNSNSNNLCRHAAASRRGGQRAEHGRGRAAPGHSHASPATQR